MTTTALLVLAATILISAFVQGATGLGFAMISAPIIALVDPTLIPVVLLLLMVPLNGYIAWRERSAIDWRGVGWISAGRAAGMVGGLWILAVVSTRGLSLVIGWSTVLAVLVAVVAPAFHPNRPALAGVGAITGVTETATGVGGPPLALAYQHGPGPTLRATIAACFLLGQVITIPALAIMGRITVEAVTVTAWLLPSVVLGAGASALVHHRLDGPLLRYLVLAISGSAGAAVLLTT